MSSPDIVVRASPLETQRFGVSVGRIEVSQAVSDPDALDTVRTCLRDDDADVVVLRYPAARVGWFAGLRSSGRDLISADTLTYWRLAVGSGRPPQADPAVTAKTAAPDQAMVADLVSDMFAGYGNHYHANPLLDPGAALAGYVQWAQRSAADDTAVVLSLDGVGPVGLATLETAGRVCEIQLAGISTEHQKRGLYAHLLAACEDASRAAGATHLVISTQAHNANVQRAWTRYGFEPVAAIMTIHAVRGGLL